VVDFLVDAVENRVERFHEGLLTGGVPKLATLTQAGKKP
jgi:hypothetical protein